MPIPSFQQFWVCVTVDRPKQAIPLILPQVLGAYLRFVCLYALQRTTSCNSLHRANTLVAKLDAELHPEPGKDRRTLEEVFGANIARSGVALAEFSGLFS